MALPPALLGAQGQGQNPMMGGQGLAGQAQQEVIGQEMADEQSGDDRILAHFNPEELAMLDEAQGGISIDPVTNLREYTQLDEMLQDPEMQDMIAEQMQGMMGGMGGQEQGFAQGGPVNEPGRPLDPELEQMREMGKGDDSELAIITTNLFNMFEEMSGERVPVNEQTGLPQFFAFAAMIPLLMTAASTAASMYQARQQANAAKKAQQAEIEADKPRHGWGGTTSGAPNNAPMLQMQPGAGGAMGWVNALTPLVAQGMEAYGQHREQRAMKKHNAEHRQAHEDELKRQGAGYQANVGDAAQFIPNMQEDPNNAERIRRGYLPNFGRRAAHGGYMHEPRHMFLGGFLGKLFNPINAIFGKEMGAKIDPIGNALGGMFGGDKGEKKKGKGSIAEAVAAEFAKRGQGNVNVGPALQQQHGGGAGGGGGGGGGDPFQEGLGREGPNPLNGRNERYRRFAEFAGNERAYRPNEDEGMYHPGDPRRARRARGGFVNGRWEEGDEPEYMGVKIPGFRRRFVEANGGMGNVNMGQWANFIPNANGPAAQAGPQAGPNMGDFRNGADERYRRFNEFAQNNQRAYRPNAAAEGLRNAGGPRQRHMAGGGTMRFPGMPGAKENPFQSALGRQVQPRGGAIQGPGKGQDDRIPRNLPNNSYILDASTVSDIGDGSSRAGINELNRYFQQLNPRYAPQQRSGGGSIKALVSDGEYEISPEQVAALGGGNHNKGAKILEEMVMRIRTQKRGKGKKLPPKAKSVGGYIAKLKN